MVFDYSTWCKCEIKNLVNNFTQKVGITGAIGSISFFADAGIDSGNFSWSKEMGVEFELNVSEILHQETTRPFEVTFTVSVSIDDLFKHVHSNDSSITRAAFQENYVAYSQLAMFSMIDQAIGNEYLTLAPTKTGHYEANGNLKPITVSNQNVFTTILTSIKSIWQNEQYRNTIVFLNGLGIVLILDPSTVPVVTALCVKALTNLQKFGCPTVIATN